MYKWYRAEVITPLLNMAITTTNGNNIITTLQARQIAEVIAPEGVYYLPYNEKLTTAVNITNAIDKMNDNFNNFVAMRQFNIDMLYNALYTEYDPLLNYDKHIEGSYTTEHHKGSKTSESANVVTTPNTTTTTTETPNTTTTETPNTTTTTSNKEFGFDSTSGKDSTSSTTSINGTNSTSITGTNKTTTTTTGSDNTTKSANDNYITTTDISETIFDNDKTLYDNYREYGNVGIQTTVDIINKEYELRLRCIGEELINEFLNLYLVSFTLDEDTEIID